MELYEVVCDRTINSDEDLKQGKTIYKNRVRFYGKPTVTI
jgi:hypothetical protein